MASVPHESIRRRPSMKAKSRKAEPVQTPGAAAAAANAGAAVRERHEAEQALDAQLRRLEQREITNAGGRSATGRV